MKLIIRLLVITMFVIAFAVTKKERYRFMLKYLVGKGGDVVVGERLLSCLDMQFWANKLYMDMEYGYKPIHSTNYDNSGFYGRPELFYLVGGFGYSVRSRRGKVIIYSIDRYDWHPDTSRDEPFYFGSPLPISLKWDKWFNICWSINSFLGAIVLQESFDRTIAISNYFWEWLGGKEFNSHMRWEFGAAEFDKQFNINKEE